MIVTKTYLPRRTFLRGIGATLALPLLDAMVPALSALGKTAANPIRRLGVIYVPNGMAMRYWTPAAEGRDFELTPILQPLAPFRDKLLMVSGLDGPSGGGTHAGASTRFLTGVKSRDRRDRRHIHGPVRGQGARAVYPARIARARAGWKGQLGHMRGQVYLRLHQHDLMAQRGNAVADGAQPSRSI